ncbi:aspartate-alanine antiporter-like transporter, partial [Fusobacterium polymorphum]
TGGMTSAPGLGAAIDALDCDEPAISYGATQPLATLCMVIFSIIIHKFVPNMKETIIEADSHPDESDFLLIKDFIDKNFNN